MPGADENSKPARKFVVDKYLPAGFMHLIAAPVGMGKTTIICQLIHALENGLAWFGEKTHPPTGVLFISADRDREETQETLERMGMSELKMRCIFTCDYAVVPLLEKLVETEARPGELVIVEPFMVFLRDSHNRMGNINDYNQVFSYANRIKRVIRKQEVTLLASGHSAKAKNGEGYQLVRERTLGSTAWSGAFSTIIYIDPADVEDPLSPLRTLSIFPRNKAGIQLNCVQEDEHGLIVEVCKKEKSNWAAMNECLEQWPLLDVFGIPEVLAWAEIAKMSAKTAQRWLNQTKADGKVEKVEHGKYRRVNPS